MKTKTIAIVIAVLILAAWIYYTYFAKKKTNNKVQKTGCEAIPEDGYYYFAYFGENSFLIDEFNDSMCENPWAGPNNGALNNKYATLFVGTKSEVMAMQGKSNWIASKTIFAQPSFVTTATKNCCKSETVCNIVPNDKLFIEVISGPAFLDQKTVNVKQLGVMKCIYQGSKGNQQNYAPVLNYTREAIVIDQAVINTGMTLTEYQSGNTYATANNPVIGRFKKI